MFGAQIPKFPIKVFFTEDSTEWVLDNESELGSNLEWFDSRDPNEKAIVTDSNGNHVVLVVEKLVVKTFQLAQNL
jgi:hypothetical protein